MHVMLGYRVEYSTFDIDIDLGPRCTESPETVSWVFLGEVVVCASAVVVVIEIELSLVG